MNNINVPVNRLDRSFHLHQAEYEEAAIRVLRSGWYVLGTEVSNFENEYSNYVGTKHCVGLADGLDALWIAFRILGIGRGDEVIVQSNAYIACVMGITINDATPIFVEPDEYYNLDPEKIEAAITPKTKAILVVHLYGQASDMETIVSIAKKHNLYIVEDCAQSHGARQNKKMTGGFGDIGCFSFYPSKNLGAFGDAGAVTVNSTEIYDKLRVFRNYGSEKKYYNMVVGTNSRLDELQAAMLRVRLSHLDELKSEREKLCRKYMEEIVNTSITLPKVRDGCETVWHQFVIQIESRDRCIDYLKTKGVGTLIHYPVPPHLSEAYKYLGYGKGSFPIAENYANKVISIPLYNGMTEDEQDYVIEVINQYE
jgi:dTDP-4-amino-4,6-dideoxygalactose transaminase